MGRKPFGRKIGPTGRKRDDFNIFALAHKRSGYPKRELIKPYKGSSALNAYGQEGTREAKNHVHHLFPHTWIKFSVYNESRIMRTYEKRKKS